MTSIKVNIKGYPEFSFHELLFQNLMELKKANRRDLDFKILISGNGMTRTGKSTLGSQIGLILDNNCTLNNYAFRGDKLIELSKKIGKNKALIYDEAKEGLDSKRAMTTYSQNLTDFFSECGFLNQFIIIILPEFFDLNKTIALNQSIFLIDCKFKNGTFDRGFFSFYNRKDKRYLYLKGKQYNNYSCQRSTFEGTFVDFFPWNKDEYNKLKMDNFKAEKNKDKVIAPTKMENKYRDCLLEAIKYMKFTCRLKGNEIGKIIGMHENTIYEINKQIRQSTPFTIDSINNNQTDTEELENTDI